MNAEDRSSTLARVAVLLAAGLQCCCLWLSMVLNPDLASVQRLLLGQRAKQTAQIQLYLSAKLPRAAEQCFKRTCKYTGTLVRMMSPSLLTAECCLWLMSSLCCPLSFMTC